jgi:hypothetical protein
VPAEIVAATLAHYLRAWKGSRSVVAVKC